jgi:uncharacterized protein (DUF362 family)
VERAVHTLLEPLGGMRAFVQPGQRVLLKPNLILPRPVEAAVTTHPEVVRAAALEVLNAGGKPVIGDSPAFGTAQAVCASNGTDVVARELGVEIIDLGRKARTCELGNDAPFSTAGLSVDAVDADVIINLPKIKTHGQMGMSLATKNMFGCVAGKRKALFHFRIPEDPVLFGRQVVAITRYLKPALTIADGIIILERDGPTSGDARLGKFLAAGQDPVAVDQVILDILGVPASTVSYLEAARAMEYGCHDLEKIRVLGEATAAALHVADYAQVEERVPIHFTLPRVIRSIYRQVMLRIREKRKQKD